MLFSSNVFIFIFLPIVLNLYFIINNRKYRNFILCAASLIFYAWGEPKYIFLMLFSILFNYLAVLTFDKFKKIKKPIFIITIIINLLLLAFYKYLDFGISSLNKLIGTEIPLANIALPIGISFYTFQIMSYVIDAYKGKVKVQKNLLNLATYVALFPQLIAGPIVRYETVEDELANRKETFDDIVIGVKRFIIGLAKKVIIANNMALVADTIYKLPIEGLGTGMLWIAALAYTFQIYFDFSGYSDMAIGLGRIFGFHFLENFNYPYLATTITEFWRRWHISLSSWFRDYVYIPLGGNKCSKPKWIRNIIIVWFLTGLWHGASWNFVLWGLYYCVLLLLEKTILKNIIPKIPKFIRWIITFFLINIGWVIFRIEDINTLGIIISRLFIFKPEEILPIFMNDFKLISSLSYIVLAIIFAFPLIRNICLKLEEKSFIFKIISYGVYLIIFLMCISLLLYNSYNPFIYFRF